MRTIVLGAVLSVAAVPAFAQPAGGRFRVHFDAGYQVPVRSFSDRFTFEAYKEEGDTAARYPIAGDAMFDGGGAVRLWKYLGAGVTVSRYTRNSRAQTLSHVPHPLYLADPRDVNGDASGITRTETGTHVQALVFLPPWRDLQLSLFAGPSYIKVEQDLVTMIRYQEVYPFDEAVFTGADARKARRSAAGFNAGVDAAWMLNRTFGVGGVVRYSGAKVKLHTSDNRTIRIDSGGTQAGLGVRVHF